MGTALLLAAVHLFIASVALNVWTYLRFKNTKKPSETHDLRAFMRDVERGGGLLKVERVSPEDVLLRSPRELGR